MRRWWSGYFRTCCATSRRTDAESNAVGAGEGAGRMAVFGNPVGGEGILAWPEECGAGAAVAFGDASPGGFGGCGVGHPDQGAGGLVEQAGRWSMAWTMSRLHQPARQ